MRCKNKRIGQTYNRFFGVFDPKNSFFVPAAAYGAAKEDGGLPRRIRNGDQAL
jgi:hypothetical protein